MLSLYSPGHSLWHRLPAGPKAAVLAVVVFASALLPASWWAAGVSAALCVAAYAVPGVGVRRLLRQAWTLRWILAITLVGQIVFLGPEPAVANTVRVVSTVTLAGLLALTTRTSVLMDAMERALRPLRFAGVDPQRAALLLTVTTSALPVVAGAAMAVREAQRARGARPGLRAFVVPFLVVALKQADELGDALTARGVR